eukprot:192732_1
MLSIFFLMSVTQSEWISVTDNPLARSVTFAGGATYGDSIYFIGGKLSRSQFQEYQISSNTIIDHGTSYLLNDVYAEHIHSSQWQHTFYSYTHKFFEDTHVEDTLHVYNLSSVNFPYDLSTYNDSISSGSCLAASEHFVFVMGGFKTHTDFNVFSLSDHLWSLGPQMQISRNDLNCIVAFDDLYAIGGNHQKSIEKISITDVHNQQWQLLTDELVEGVGLVGIGLYENIIWVVGGRTVHNGDTIVATDYVYNIDTTDASVTLLDERLPYAVVAGKGVTLVAHDVLYVFGGTTSDLNGSTIDIVEWMWYNLTEPTTEPTNDPSAIPTQGPTDVPTNGPSKTPTNGPTDVPTNDPSHNPTNNPSQAFAMDHYISSAASENVASAQHQRIDPLVTIFIGICCILCLMIIMVTIMWKKMYKRLKMRTTNPRQKGKDDSKHGLNKTDVKPMDDSAHKRNAEDESPSVSLCEVVDDNKGKTTTDDVTVKAMIDDKIFSGLIATAKGGSVVVQKEGEKDHIDNEEQYVADDSVSNDSL